MVAEIHPSRSRKSEGFKTRVVIQLGREFHHSEVDLTTGKLLAVVPGQGWMHILGDKMLQQDV